MNYLIVELPVNVTIQVSKYVSLTLLSINEAFVKMLICKAILTWWVMLLIPRCLSLPYKIISPYLQVFYPVWAWVSSRCRSRFPTGPTSTTMTPDICNKTLLIMRLLFILPNCLLNIIFSNALMSIPIPKKIMISYTSVKYLPWHLKFVIRHCLLWDCFSHCQIACITPSSANVTETVNTLRYASRAKRIKTKPTVKLASYHLICLLVS